MDLCFKILDSAMNTKAVSKGTDEVSLVYSQEYVQGDRIILETSGESAFVWLQMDDARIKIEFGRTVEIDRIILYTRADFPHDNWWRSVKFAFSDESELEMKMEKSARPHEIEFPAKKVCWLEMNHMIKSEEPSPFPALSQIEVYGREILK